MGGDPSCTPGGPAVSSDVVAGPVRRTEEQRLVALHLLGLLDAPADDELQAVVRVAAAVAGVPFATLNLIDADRQCQLTSTGFEGSTSARADSMCALHFEEGRTVHLADASLDPRYARNPWVDGRFATVRLYASVPLVTADGDALGSLCVFDTRPGALTADQLERLGDLGRVLLSLFERQRQVRTTEAAHAEVQRQRRVASAAMEVLEERTELVEAVLDTIDVAVVAAGPDGRLTLFNRSAQRWHEVDADPSAAPEEHAARYALVEADGVTPMTAERVPLHRALHEGEVVSEEMVIASLGRQPRTVLASGRAMARADGSPLGAVVVMSDVTAAREHTRALEELHAELADRGAELERSNAELARFAAVASHDLRAPLTVVDGYLELLEDELAEGPALQAGWVAAGRRGVRRMQHLTSSLLDYAAAGAPARPLELTDVAALAREALSDLAAAVEEAGAVVEVEPLPSVPCDPVAVRQLLQNLVANAVHHRRPGRSCRVVVSARPAAGGGGGWVFSVADDGPGVLPEDRARVFEVFTSLAPAPADGSAPQRRSGHGIGLATCQRVVERHGGRVWLEETPGGGATVLFTLAGAPAA
ncbi:GAF domain-containing protein [Quadrisphaera sp. INWT6]|nr:GAF domain-containing protein [Quadrisphaera sp. INWT6]